MWCVRGIRVEGGGGVKVWPIAVPTHRLMMLAAICDCTGHPSKCLFCMSLRIAFQGRTPGKWGTNTSTLLVPKQGRGGGSNMSLMDGLVGACKDSSLVLWWHTWRRKHTSSWGARLQVCMHTPMSPSFAQLRGMHILHCATALLSPEVSKGGNSKQVRTN